jgi:glycosyltransferase involved in cell wall biosynthesis
VILDALATGLPVIATPHTAAPDLIDHGVEGFIVPIRSTDEIVAKLEVLRREPERRAEMSASARRRAQRHTWEGYERALAASVATALSRH